MKINYENSRTFYNNQITNCKIKKNKNFSFHKQKVVSKEKI